MIQCLIFDNPNESFERYYSDLSKFCAVFSILATSQRPINDNFFHNVK